MIILFIILNHTQPDDQNPDTTILNLGASEVQLAKEYYKKPAVLTNYTRAVAQTLHVLSSGKPYDEDPIPPSKNASIFEKAQRIVNFEKVVADNTPEPDQASDVKVCSSSSFHSAQCHKNVLETR
jgi:hypothetical protein